jgi:hypothetical protein
MLPSTFDLTSLTSFTTAPNVVSAPATPTAPQIVNFGGVEVQQGWYYFTGQVQGGTVGGLTISFAGVPSLAGQTAVTNADGTFSLLVQVQTDGSDYGTVTAQTSVDGQASNLAWYDINPM